MATLTKALAVVAAESGTAPSQPRRETLYGYIPTEYVCIIFIVLFAISTLLHVAQAIRFRMWWIFPTAVLAGIAEVIGWSGRLWSSRSPALLNPYLMQIVTTIIAPTPLVAANFIILATVIKRLGSQFSRLGPRMYTIVFCSFDIIALVIQAIGGAQASQAVQTGGDPEKGGNIMLGGIVFQMFAITIYVTLASEFLLRWKFNKPIRSVQSDIQPSIESKNQLPAELDGQRNSQGPSESSFTPGKNGRSALTKKMKLMVFGLCFSTIVIFIRSVYRTIELADGWSGRIIGTQVYFNVLDGAMITLAMFCLNFFHPGWLLH